MKRFYVFLDKWGRKLFGGRGFSNFTVVKAIKRFIHKNIYGDTAEVRGLKFYVDVVDGIVPGERYQKGVADVFDKKIKKGDTVVDLGANIGYFTCIAAQLVGDGGKVFAFEPEPRNIELLRKNVKANKFKNVVIVPAPVSDKSGKTHQLFLSGAHSSVGFSRFGEKRDSVSVDSIVLDDFFGDYGEQISLVKMDIIGSEAKAFRGMKNLLLRNKNIKLAISFAPKDLIMAGDNPADFLRGIFRLKFRVYNTDNNLEEVREEDISGFVARHLNGDKIVRTNLFCER
jgi:FkbM family methyltransferase